MFFIAIGYNFPSKWLVLQLMKIIVKIVAFLLLMSVTVEKMAGTFIDNFEEIVLLEKEESKKENQEGEPDNEKKIEESDKYLKLYMPFSLHGSSPKNLFNIFSTPLNIHPYNEDDIQPPKITLT
jgi:hypothetical protein